MLTWRFLLIKVNFSSIDKPEAPFSPAIVLHSPINHNICIAGDLDGEKYTPIFL